MASKQLCEFEKGQIVAYNHSGISLSNIAKKLSCHHSTINIFLKNKKTGNYHRKEDCDYKKKKPSLSEDRKIVKALSHSNIPTTQN